MGFFGLLLLVRAAALAHWCSSGWHTVGEMFVRVQKVRQGGRVYEYVHIVEGYRDPDGKVRHRVVANLGRRDRLKDSGALDNLAAAFTRLDPAPGRYLVGAML